MPATASRLNGVRPRRPEQSFRRSLALEESQVSMESGLEDRNNTKACGGPGTMASSLNGVRPRRPEQSGRPEQSMGETIGSQWSPA